MRSWACRRAPRRRTSARRTTAWRLRRTRTGTATWRTKGGRRRRGVSERRRRATKCWRARSNGGLSTRSGKSEGARWRKGCGGTTAPCTRTGSTASTWTWTAVERVTRVRRTAAARRRRGRSPRGGRRPRRRRGARRALPDPQRPRRAEDLQNAARSGSSPCPRRLIPTPPRARPPSPRAWPCTLRWPSPSSGGWQHPGSGAKWPACALPPPPLPPPPARPSAFPSAPRRARRRPRWRGSGRRRGRSWGGRGTGTQPLTRCCTTTPAATGRWTRRRGGLWCLRRRKKGRWRGNRARHPLGSLGMAQRSLTALRRGSSTAAGAAGSSSRALLSPSPRMTPYGASDGPPGTSLLALSLFEPFELQQLLG